MVYKSPQEWYLDKELREAELQASLRERSRNWQRADEHARVSIAYCLRALGEVGYPQTQIVEEARHFRKFGGDDPRSRMPEWPDHVPVRVLRGYVLPLAHVKVTEFALLSGPGQTRHYGPAILAVDGRVSTGAYMREPAKLMGAPPEDLTWITPKEIRHLPATTNSPYYSSARDCYMTEGFIAIDEYPHPQLLNRALQIVLARAAVAIA